MMTKIKILLASLAVLTLTACDDIGKNHSLSCEKVFDESVVPHIQSSNRYDTRGNLAGYLCVIYDEVHQNKLNLISVTSCVDTIMNKGAFGVERSDKQVISKVITNPNGSVECFIRNLNYTVPFSDANFIAKEYYPVSLRYMYYPYQDKSGYDFTYKTSPAN